MAGPPKQPDDDDLIKHVTTIRGHARRKLADSLSDTEPMEPLSFDGDDPPSVTARSVDWGSYHTTSPKQLPQPRKPSPDTPPLGGSDELDPRHLYVWLESITGYVVGLLKVRKTEGLATAERIERTLWLLACGMVGLVSGAAGVLAGVLLASYKLLPVIMELAQTVGR